jgi:sugar phosphate isomerase/epimerase
MKPAESHAMAKVNRRQFLGSTAGGAAAAMAVARGLATAGPVSAAKGKWKMRLSGSSIDFSSLPIEQACQRLAALGFEAVDIWSAHAGCPHLDDAQKRLGAEGLKAVLAKNKLRLYAFSVYAGGYPRYAGLLGKCGGGVAVRGSAGPCKPNELRPRVKAFLEALKPEAELAEKYNSYLAIENHGAALLDSIDSIKTFVGLNKNPRLGIALAPYHIQALGQSVEDAILACGPQLLFFYAWQDAPGLGQLPGHGPADFTPWLAALAKIDYKWYVNPFMHNEPKPDVTAAALAKSRDYLKGCWQRAVGRGQ